MKKIISILLVTCLLTGCGAASESTSANQPQDITMTVGEKAVATDYKLSLYYAYMDEDIRSGKRPIHLVYEFENTSDHDLYISTSDFSGFADDYLVSQGDVLISNISETKEYDYLSGNIPSGKKIKGYISFLAPTEFQVFESRYTDKDGNHIIFSVNWDQFIISE